MPPCFMYSQGKGKGESSYDYSGGKVRPMILVHMLTSGVGDCLTNVYHASMLHVLAG